ncbi:MAG: DNA-3-methyladenine glycosylase II [Pontimonas sp.]|jgi:DNA-3-methyladenine glycosylase II
MIDLIDRFVPPDIDKKTPETYFDVLVSSIIGQQLSVKAADTIEARVRESVKDFAPATLLAEDPLQMREQGLSHSKVSYIQGLAEAFEAGTIDPHHLDELADKDVSATLTAVKGVGPWTAEMFMIFGMGRPDVWSPGDLGLRKAVKALFGEDTNLTEVSEPWRPYRSYASLYLWKFSDQ